MNIVYLGGGVGGAKLLHGLYRTYDRRKLSAVINTGDDFVHWGLNISPDLDTVMYTLAEQVHPKQGWGLKNETFATQKRVETLGGPAWFQLGDRDLATHLFRTQALADGHTLTQVTHKLCRNFDVQINVLPMADRPRPTWIIDGQGRHLPFQDWLVKKRAKPKVADVRYRGTRQATMQVLQALDQADCIIIGPSNPYVSILPILTLQGVRKILANKKVLAISPIVGGQAVKGPLAAMLPALTGLKASATSALLHYFGLLSGAIIQVGDGHEALYASVNAVLETNIVMKSLRDRERLAQAVVSFAEAL